MTTEKQFKGIKVIPKAKFRVGEEVKWGNFIYIVAGCDIEYDWEVDSGIPMIVYLLVVKGKENMPEQYYDGVFEEVLEEVRT